MLGQAAWGRALTRSQAIVMAWVPGQVAAIFSRRRRPGEPGGGVEGPVAQGLGLGAGEVAVQGDQLEPGDECGVDQGRGQPRAVDREGLRWQSADACLLPGPDAVFDLA